MSVKSSGEFGAGLARAALRYPSDGRLSQNRAEQTSLRPAVPAARAPISAVTVLPVPEHPRSGALPIPSAQGWKEALSGTGVIPHQPRLRWIQRIC